MTKKTIVIITGILLTILVFPLIDTSVFAQSQYFSSNQISLNDAIDISKERVKIAQENPGAGSGTPLFAADGILGATVLSSCIFGGIATVFFVKSRKGRYAAIGRG